MLALLILYILLNDIILIQISFIFSQVWNLIF